MYLEEYSPDERRIIRAKYDDFELQDIDYEKQTAIAVSHRNEYNTSLNYCTCQDFQKRKKPCKHIYRLTYKLGKFNLYENFEQEEIAVKINKIKDLITAEKLKDIYYRKRDQGKYYTLKKDYQTDFLENIGLIKLYEVPVIEIVEQTYKVSELKEMLKNTYDIKGLKKQDLINLFCMDEKLVKKIESTRTDEYKVELLISDYNKAFFIECLNFRIYNQLQYEDELEYNENETIPFDMNNAEIQYNQSKEFKTSVSEIKNSIPKEKSFITGLLLCWFLGFIGAHRLYYNKRKTALIMFCISVLSAGKLIFVSAIWALIDFVFLIKNRKLQKNYEQKSIILHKSIDR